jgi:hypothetical protein
LPPFGKSFRLDRSERIDGSHTLRAGSSCKAIRTSAEKASGRYLSNLGLAPARFALPASERDVKNGGPRYIAQRQKMVANLQGRKSRQRFQSRFWWLEQSV